MSSIDHGLGTSMFILRLIYPVHRKCYCLRLLASMDLDLIVVLVISPIKRKNAFKSLPKSTRRERANPNPSSEKSKIF